MATIGRMDVDPLETGEALVEARGGDPVARWAAVEACRTYLRLVVGKNRWGKKVGEPATSDLVQDTILEGWRGFARFEGRTPDQLRAWLRAILIHAIIKATTAPQSRLPRGRRRCQSDCRRPDAPVRCRPPQRFE